MEKGQRSRECWGRGVALLHRAAGRCNMNGKKESVLQSYGKTSVLDRGRRLQARKSLVGLGNRKASVPTAWCLGEVAGQDTEWQVGASSQRVLVNGLDFILRAMAGLWKVLNRN